MDVFVHALQFLFSASVIWFFAGLLVASVDRVARRFHAAGFTVAFFVLGFFTSISEFSVVVNSSIDRVPQVSAGNLAGASFVLLLFIIPILAVSGNGIQLSRVLTNRNLCFNLFVILAPVLFLLDGDLTRAESLLMLLLFGTLVYFISHQDSSSTKTMKMLSKDIFLHTLSSRAEIFKIFIGAIFIFLAGHLMVNEVTYFAEYFTVPGSLIGLLVLSLGTNVPELGLALRALLKNRKDIAFGDYLGSAATNTLLFALLGLYNGAFLVEPREFLFTAVLLSLGLLFFFVFARTEHRISRYEGFVLLLFYALFLTVQFWNFAGFAMQAG